MSYDNDGRWEPRTGENRNGGPAGYGDLNYERQALKWTRRCFSRVGLVYVAYLAMVNLSQVAVMMLLLITGIADYMDPELYMLVSILSMYPLAVPLTALFIKWVPKRGQAGRESWGFGKLCGFFVVAMGILYMGNIIGNILMTLAGMIKGEPILNELDTLVMSMEPWTILVAVVIVAPIIEELVFRKFLLDRIAGHGYWTAMLVSGLLFGVAHGNFYQFFYAFGLGVIFSYVYLCTGKIVYTIVFHMLINFWGSIMPLGLLKIVEEQVFLGGLLAVGNMMLMAGFIICSIILMAVCWKDIRFLSAGDGLGGGKRAAAVLGNLGMVLFLICGIILFVLSF